MVTSIRPHFTLSHFISDLEEEGQEGLHQEQAQPRQGEAQQKVNELSDQELFNIGEKVARISHHFGSG